MDARSNVIPYRELKKDKREIRLLLLEDLPKDATYSISGSIPLKAKLVHTSLDLYRECRNAQCKFKLEQLVALDRWTHPRNWQRPPFYALSYVWGDPTPVREIEIDGQPLKVGASLGDALEAILLYTPNRVIWADAISINQKDTIEKSWQVQQMGKIYARARAVISWLGPATSDSDAAMRALQGLHALMEKIKFSRRVEKNTALLADAFRRFRTYGEDDLQAIENLFARDYWTRVWIIQELAVPRNSLFICGSCVVTGIDQVITTLDFLLGITTGDDHAELLDFWKETLASNDVVLTPIMARFKNFRSLKATRSSRKQPAVNVPFLLSEAGASRRCKASDPRDFIFALFPLVTDTENFRIVPDYDQSTKEVFKSIARQLVANDCLQSILLMSDAESLIPGLPSWAPDWSSSQRYAGLMETGALLQLEAERKSEKVQAGVDELVVRGFIIGRIDTFAIPFKFEDRRRRSPEEVWLGIAQWISQIACTTIHHASTEESPQLGNTALPTFESVFGRSALTRTVAGDRNSATGAPYGETALELEKLIHDEDFVYSINVARDTGISGPYEMATLQSVETYLRDLYARVVANESRVFAIGDRCLGLSTKNCEEGDVVAWLDKTNHPCVLRPARNEISTGLDEKINTKTRFRLVGSAFVDGIVHDDTIGAKFLEKIDTIVLC